MSFQNSGPENGDYEGCHFINCDFSYSDLSGSNFLECEFIQCNLSLTKLENTSLREVIFKNCKLTGLHFDDCNKLLFSVSFENCTIDVCSFQKLKMKNTHFSNSRIYEADFEDTDLSSSSFRMCDLSRTIFKNTNLEDTDFRDSVNYSIDPESNRIKKAMFSVSGLAGLLDKYDIIIDMP